MDREGGKGPAKGMAPAAAEGRLEEAEGWQTGRAGGHQQRRDLTALDLLFVLQPSQMFNLSTTFY